MTINKIETHITDIDYIFHIADIHIRPYRRHLEYTDVFERVYDNIKKRATSNSLIVVAGDIVHAKTEMSPELVSTVYKFLLNLSSICNTIIIPGNHDGNLNNLSRMDTLTPIIDAINLKNLYYLKDNGIYEFGNYYFVHMSIFTDASKYIVADDVPSDKIKIALYHGVVDKSVNEFGYKLRNSDISEDIFDGYDLVLLGDIHKRQFLKDNIAYPGSLIQQNHGEELQHGYIIWDMNNISGKFENIYNDYGYYTIELKDKTTIPNVPNMPKRCRLRIQAYDLSSTDLNNLITQIKKQYNPTEITINRINSFLSDASLSKLDIPNIEDVSYQNALIEEYLNSTTLTSKEYISLIKDINIFTNSTIEIEDIIKNVRWSPISFEWSNMFSYGENNIIDFTQMKGVVGIFAPNTSGKSAVVDSLSFCLFDKTGRDFKPINIMNNKKDEFNCKVKFEMSNKEYSISKRIWKNKKGDPMYKSSFSVIDENEDEISLNGENRWTTNKNIYNRIGSFEDFILTSFSMQNKNSNFIEMGHSDRKDLIIQFVGLGLFDKLYAIAADKLKEINVLLRNLSSENWDDKLVESKDEQKKLKSEYNIINENKQSEINTNKSLKDNLELLKDQLIDIDEDLDIIILNEQLSDAEEKIKNKNLTIQDTDLKIKLKTESILENKKKKETYEQFNIEQMYKELQDIISEKKELNSEMNILTAVIDNKNNKMKNLKELEYDPDCEYCMNNIFVKDAINTKKELEIDNSKMKELLDDFNSLKEIEKSKNYILDEYEEYKNVKELLSNCEVEKSKLQVFKSRVESELNALIIKKDKILSDIETYDYLKLSIENNHRVNSLIFDLKSQSTQCEENIDELETELRKIYGKIQVEKSNQKTFSDNIKKLNDYSTQSECYKLYMDAIKRDGIPYQLISKIIPAIEVEINNILGQIVDFSIMINLDDSKNINMFIVYDETNFWPLELSSGMERFISSVAIRVALTNISNLPRPNFLIIDEGWGSLDSENLNSVSMLMDYLKTQFDFILLISHVDQIKEVADILIDIKKEDGFSFINHTN